MKRFIYLVETIDGDYARLRKLEEGNGDMVSADAGANGSLGETKLVARALLPPEIIEGTKLLYEWMQYSILEEQSQ